MINRNLIATLVLFVGCFQVPLVAKSVDLLKGMSELKSLLMHKRKHYKKFYNEIVENKKGHELVDDDCNVVYTLSLEERFLSMLLLDAAKSSNYYEAMKLLIAAGADINATDFKVGVYYHAVTAHNTYTPLVWAMRAANLNKMRVLLDFGADPNCSDKYGETPLHKLCAEDVLYHFDAIRKKEMRKKAIELLVEYGASCDQKKDNNGLTPLNMEKKNKLSQNLIAALQPQQKQVSFKLPGVIKDSEQKDLQKRLMGFIKITLSKKTFAKWLFDGLCNCDWRTTD